jgi:hypothetical protein
MHTRGQGLSLNTIVIAAVVLIVLIVLIGFFTGYFGKWTGSFQGATQSSCEADGLRPVSAATGCANNERQLFGNFDLPPGQICCQEVPKACPGTCETLSGRTVSQCSDYVAGEGWRVSEQGGFDCSPSQYCCSQ